MPRARSLIHKELGQTLRRSFFTRSISIEGFTAGVPSASGYRAPTPGEEPDLRAIPAAIAPVSRRGSDERRFESTTIAESTHDILLLGYFPQITARMRAVDDRGEIYDILKPDVDDQQTLTRLQARQVSPVAIEGR
ncbi:MAG TPA: hypothetical protein VEW95_09445 [Candidatus Limnocylindrales bacterium]|nr:hypothetical protein [Candidatus Limnocylindrales bacterium]